LVWLSAFCFALATKNSHWSSIAAILVASLNTGEIQKHITGRSFTNFKDSVPNYLQACTYVIFRALYLYVNFVTQNSGPRNRGDLISYQVFLISECVQINIIC
jgi:hypothetical protein